MSFAIDGPVFPDDHQGEPEVDPEPARAVLACYGSWRPRRELDLLLLRTVLDARHLPPGEAVRVGDMLSKIEGPNPQYTTLSKGQRGYLLGLCKKYSIALPPTSERILPEVKRLEVVTPEVLKPENLPKRPPMRLPREEV